MPISNFPKGFSNGVNLRGMNVLNIHAGSVFWVDSATGSNGYKGTFDRPFATLDYAIGRCTANKGDIIMIKPNHAETITGVGGITADIAGISIIGLGNYNQRPRFLMDGGTTVTFVVSAADVYIENCVFAGGHNGIVRCFNITGKGFTTVGVEIEDNTTDEHFLVIYDASGADNTADGLTVIGTKWVTIDAGVTDLVSTTGSIDRLTIEDTYFCADAATGAGTLLMATGKVVTGLAFNRNVLICGNTSTDLMIDNDATTNTGVAAYNLCGHHDAAAMIVIDCDGIRQFENYSTDADTTSGALIPAASSIT